MGTSITLLLIFAWVNSQAEIDFPQNAAVLADQQTILNCRSEGKKWWKYKSRTKEENFLFKDGNFSANCLQRCSIISTERNQFDLHVNKTRLSDAGTYICVEESVITTNHSVTARHLMELIVIESDPECGTNLTGVSDDLKEGDHLLMWCIIEFRGNFEPTMEWKNDITGEIISSQLTITPNRDVKSELQMKLTTDDHGVSFSCTTHFNSTNVESIADNFSHQRNAARNAPLYKNTWISPTINISRKASTTVASAIGLPNTVHTTVAESDSDSYVVLLIVSVVAFILLCIIVLRCTVMKKSNKEQTESNNDGPISSQDANNVRTTNSRVTFRQNTSDRVYAKITHEDHVYSAEPIHRVTSNEAAGTSESFSMSTAAADPQISSYVGVWMEGPDGARGGSSEDVICDVSAYDFVQRNTSNRDMVPCPYENEDWQRENAGADGTVYTEVNTANGCHVLPTTQQHPPIQSLFSKSIYASIEHTAQNITRQHRPV